MNTYFPEASELAAYIISAITDEFEHRPQAQAARSFAELHNYLDANDFLIEAEETFGYERDTADDNCPVAVLEDEALAIVDLWLAHGDR
jgi:hypothetical protein